mmetsp:Transcript_16803/g.52539  ORF Transcript_16803/g.52539 Transcript_16803/m.52539 type:complete len:202 (-) Transcript_16803:598-1203(-)
MATFAHLVGDVSDAQRRSPHVVVGTQSVPVPADKAQRGKDGIDANHVEDKVLRLRPLPHGVQRLLNAFGAEDLPVAAHQLYRHVRIRQSVGVLRSKLPASQHVHCNHAGRASVVGLPVQAKAVVAGLQPRPAVLVRLAGANARCQLVERSTAWLVKESIHRWAVQRGDEAVQQLGKQEVAQLHGGQGRHVGWEGWAKRRRN